jgi:hypothetical protein
MADKTEKQKRPLDDFIRMLAVFICAGPVATFCALHIMSFTIASAGGISPNLNEVNAGMRDIVFIIIGAAVGLAFGRGSIKPEQSISTLTSEPTK